MLKGMGVKEQEEALRKCWGQEKHGVAFMAVDGKQSPNAMCQIYLLSTKSAFFYNSSHKLETHHHFIHELLRDSPFYISSPCTKPASGREREIDGDDTDIRFFFLIVVGTKKVSFLQPCIVLSQQYAISCILK